MRVRRSYNSLHTKDFCNPKTGPWQKLNDSNWYIKKYKGQLQFYIGFSSFYQAMPEKCFYTTIENSRELNKEQMLQQLQQFKEANNG